MLKMLLHILQENTISIKKWCFIALFFTTSLIQAQSLSVGICVQNAFNFSDVNDAQILIFTLDQHHQTQQVDTLLSSLYVTKELAYPKTYRMVVQKEDFYTLDTTFTLEKTSRSRRKRLGLMLRPIQCIYLNGKVKNALTHQVISQGILQIENLNDSSLTNVSFENGAFKYCCQCSTSYRIHTQLQGYFPSTHRIDFISNDCIDKIGWQQHLSIPIAQSYDASFFEGDTLVLSNFTFVGQSSQLSPRGQVEFKRLAKVLTEKPEISVSLFIQACSFTDRKQNRRLAEKRARTLEALLTQKGIASYRYFLKCSGKMAKQNRYKQQQLSLWLRK